MKRVVRLRQSVKGWIFPPACGACDAPLSSERQIERPFLCEPCEATLKTIGEHYCSICGQSYESADTGAFRCANCGGRNLGIDFAVSAYRSAGVARDLMHRYKYRKQLHLSRLMGSLITAVWNDERLQSRDWIIVPVPLHPKRMRTRGFNQSHEIAQELIRIGGGGTKMRLQPMLKRVRDTIRQARLDRKERLENLHGAFELIPGTNVEEEGISVLLVDDVMTTGTTVSECALVLRESLDIDVIAAASVMRG